MSTFNGPNTLPNRIPHDENEAPVSVLYSYDPSTKRYHPIRVENGVQVTALGSRDLNYQIMHDSIVLPDTIIPTNALGQFDFSGYTNIIIDIKLVGVGSYVTLQPLYWNPVTNMYHSGQSQRFIESQRIYCDAAGCSDVYFLPIELQGAATVVVAGA